MMSLQSTIATTLLLVRSATVQGFHKAVEQRSMSHDLPVPVELTDAELEMVSAGQNVAAGNLVNVQVNELPGHFESVR